MSRGNKAFYAGVGLFALAFAFVWAGPAAAALTVSGNVSSTDEKAPEAGSGLEVEVDFAGPSVGLTWNASPSDFARPEPTGLDFTSGGSFSNVNDVTHYNIWRSELGGDPALVGEVVSSGAATYAYSDDTVESGVSYDYTVTAADRGGNESAGIESGPVTLGPPPNADIFPTADIDYGDVGADEVASETITVSNAASDPDAILSVKPTAEGDGFSVSTGTLTLGAGDEGTFDVSFDAAVVGNVNGAYEGTLTIKTNDPDNRETIIALSANVTGGLDTPVLDLSGTSFNFAAVVVGESRTRTLTVTNKGGLDLEASLALSGDDAFSIDVTDVTLGADEEADVAIVFSPAATGDFSATIAITSNDPGSPTDEVTATGSGTAELVVRVVVVEIDGVEREVKGFFDGDDDIDFDDFFVFADNFGLVAEDDDYDATIDLDGDGDVDFDDFFVFADFFGIDLANL